MWGYNCIAASRLRSKYTTNSPNIACCGTVAARACPRTGFVFTPISDNNSPEQVYAYFHSLISTLLEP